MPSHHPLYCLTILLASSIIHTLATQAPESSENLAEGTADTIPAALQRPQIELPGDAENAPETTENVSGEPTFVHLYQEGVKAYDNELWYSCANKIENAVKDYHMYKNTLTDCRLECEDGVRTSKLTNMSGNFEAFALYFKFLESADCFRRCKDEMMSGRPRVTERLEKAFERRIPYQYLQFCYYKLDRFKMSAAASYTFLLKNPNDTDTIQNIQFYRDRLGVPQEDFQDLEMVPYKEHLIRGEVAYKDGDWSGVVDHMEQCLEEFFVQSRRCHVDCQANHRMKGREFYTGVADLIFSILMCQLDCEEQLSIIFSEPTPFLLQTVFHYLNYAYYMINDLEKSVESTASFLALNSSHAVILENKRVLQDKLGYSDDKFKPRKALTQYVNQRKNLQDLMDVLLKNFRFGDLNESPEDDEEETQEDSPQGEPEPDDWMTRYEKLGMHLVAKASDLKREGRFVTDGLLKPEQCEELLLLVEGMKPGARGLTKFDLNTAKERLEISPDEDFEAALRLFVRAAEVIRHYTQRYTEQESFYLKHTSLVCWENQGKESCLRQEDGTCVDFEDFNSELFKDGFHTVTYLNTVDEDGDFQFLNDKTDVDSSFGVKCGRTVGYSDGDRHTLSVPRGTSQRCNMHIEYTVYRNDDEKEYRDLIALLHNIDEVRTTNALRDSEQIMQKFKDRGVEIVKEGAELKGKERFVADKFATDAQCDTMKNMVLSGALVGDGYEHLSSKPSFISPHTEHERYQGITVYRAAKLTHSGMVSLGALQTFLELSEHSRQMVERYFNLTKPLFFDYTHLVCRTAIEDGRPGRQDLSHPVHSDNCVLQPDETCIKDYPAFTQRDYSAILYLNDEFEGGEFFFAHANTTEQVSLRPKCGRLVGFNAGEYHGVRAVRSGQRCALALWFTHNPNFKELAHVHARKVVKQLLESQAKDEL